MHGIRKLRLAASHACPQIQMKNNTKTLAKSVKLGRGRLSLSAAAAAAAAAVKCPLVERLAHLA
jgi:hypothetical protein